VGVVIVVVGLFVVVWFGHWSYFRVSKQGVKINREWEWRTVDTQCI